MTVLPQHAAVAALLAKTNPAACQQHIWHAPWSLGWLVVLGANDPVAAASQVAWQLLLAVL